MTTRLAGQKTFFLPFNKDVENPVNPRGHKTAYLWEQFWRKDILFNLLQNYLHLEVEQENVYNSKNKGFEIAESEKLIFPRFHQYDVVQSLLAAAEHEGPGNSYLVQHSAGSGKSNSIAWLSHGLRQLFNENGKRVFDSIIVITDRKVLDQQLQNTITQFEQVKGTVVPITKTSQQLKESLEKGKDIIVSTLQKFPVISDAISELAGKNFAVVIDEAHSSQTGETSKHLKKTLSVNLEEAEDDDATGDDIEDEVIREIRQRGKQNHISYFAFTATPKNKTLELFGTPLPDGGFEPFHTYDMRQAIAEGFIVDVLRNYSTFSRYFKLVKSVDDDNEYEAGKAVRALTSYVDLQPHAIETKSRIMLNHFMKVTVNAIQGKGRGMLVTRSRLHAVKYFLMFRKIMKEKGLNIKPLVAFSGTVKDPDTNLEHTENSLNALGQRIHIQDSFRLPEYRILIVANKFQTGFDCPPLHTMWVDKKLSGVQAVQTLSRLNRKMSGKSADDTVVLDFVNEAEDIKTAFQPFYQQTTLVEETDPNKLYDIETELSNLDVYTPADVDDYCEIFYDENKEDELLQPVLDRVVEQWRRNSEEDREAFRSYLQSYIRLYGYLGQLIDFTDPMLEKTYVFARSLNKKLPKRESAGLPQEIFDEVDLDSFRIQKRYEGHIKLEAEDGELAGMSAGAGGVEEPEVDYLSNIIENLNETFGLELDERDKIRL
ncbi:MAG: DEAD/DEAH box helicase family protein, partial [Balneolaceae bacterium]